MTPRLPLLLAAVGLAGCGGGLSFYGEPGGLTAPGDDDGPGTAAPSGPVGDDDDGRVDDDAVPIALDELSPTFGPNGGGTEVEVLGSFDDDTEILFDGVEARVLDRRANRMIVEVPAASVEGWVDVEAVSGTRSADLPEAFQYWSDGRGLAGALGEVSYFDLVGNYWVDPTDVSYASFGFTEPLDWELWRSYTSVQGTCQHNFQSGFSGTFYETGASYVELAASAASQRLESQGDGSYGAGPAAGVVPGQTYDLAPIAGDASWPVDEVQGMVRVPGSFRVTSPNLDRDTAPNTNRAIDLVWTGTGGDYVVIYLGRQAWDQQNGVWVDVDYVTCGVGDTGSFTVPGQTWPDWFADELIHIRVGRVVERRVPLAHNGSESRVAGVYWVYGAANTN